MAGCAKTIQINLGVIEVAELPASCAKIISAPKIRILFFYPSTVRYSPEEENRRLEKLCCQVGLVHSLDATVNFRQALSVCPFHFFSNLLLKGASNKAIVRQ